MPTLPYRKISSRNFRSIPTIATLTRIRNDSSACARPLHRGKEARKRLPFGWSAKHIRTGPAVDNESS